MPCVVLFDIFVFFSAVGLIARPLRSVALLFQV